MTSSRTRIDRRTAIGQLVSLTLVSSPAAGLLTACGGGMGGGADDDFMMSGDGMGDGMMRDMPAIHDLLTRHNKIRRQVEDLPDGIRAQTTSDDPTVARLIQTHVHQMKTRIENGDPIRQMDPLFRELFEHYRAITMTVIDIPAGVQVTETSTDPEVTLLIRQHARRAVSEFVADGMDRAMRPTPLPPGYED